jgi:outer membrane protein TolC
VRALGPVPQAPAELAAYRERLERVSRALDLAHERYAAGLAERDEVVGLAGALSAMAASARVPDELTPDLSELRRRLDEALGAERDATVKSAALAR